MSLMWIEDPGCGEDSLHCRRLLLEKHSKEPKKYYLFMFQYLGGSGSSLAVKVSSVLIKALQLAAQMND